MAKTGPRYEGAAVSSCGGSPNRRPVDRRRDPGKVAVSTCAPSGHHPNDPTHSSGKVRPEWRSRSIKMLSRTWKECPEGAKHSLAYSRSVAALSLLDISACAHTTAGSNNWLVLVMG